MNNLSENSIKKQINQGDNLSELEQLYAELKAIETMTDEEVCEEWNVDYRHEIVDAINDEIDILKSHEDEDLSDDEYNYDDTLDPAFTSLAEFYGRVFSL